MKPAKMNPNSALRCVKCSSADETGILDGVYSIV